jgi:ribosomal protein S18 acetylase RimI-like enzyme
VTTQGSVRIAPLASEHIDEVITIHLAGMGYTLNSRLGRDHMRFLYQTISGDPSGYAGVALEGERLAGVVTGVLDPAKFTTRLLRKMPATRLAATALRLLVKPALLLEWRKAQVIAAPVRMGSAEVEPVLTAIVVDAHIQGRGIGRALVEAFEEFLRTAGVLAYRLDTLTKNERAIRFYEQLGFLEVARRADSIIFVRQLAR